MNQDSTTQGPWKDLELPRFLEEWFEDDYLYTKVLSPANIITLVHKMAEEENEIPMKHAWPILWDNRAKTDFDLSGILFHNVLIGIAQALKGPRHLEKFPQRTRGKEKERVELAIGIIKNALKHNDPKLTELIPIAIIIQNQPEATIPDYLCNDTQLEGISVGDLLDAWFESHVDTSMEGQFRPNSGDFRKRMFIKTLASHFTSIFGKPLVEVIADFATVFIGETNPAFVNNTLHPR